MKGTYILTIKVIHDLNVIIGSLGLIFFPKGLYVYVGSAMADNGALTLLNRVKRHVLKGNTKKIHWHIDYLLNHEYVNIIRLYLIPSKERYECVIAQEILKKTDKYITNFGASDCSCKSHLFHFNHPNNFKLSDII
jgi:sugar fermentation stimulation protein A